MLPFETVLALVDRIYAAAEDATLWPAALEGIGTATGSSAASILYHNLQSHDGAVDVAIGVDPGAAAAYQAYYHRLDPWGNSPRTPMLAGAGTIFDGEQLISRADLKKTAYYNEFARPYDLTRVLAGTILLDGPVISVISLLRGEEAQPHGEPDRQTLQALLPHLIRGMQMHGRLAPARSSGDVYAAALATLDSLAAGVALVDDSARALFLNRTAERLLRRRDGLFVERRTLTAANPQERDALRFLIRRAARRSAADALHAGGALSISRPSLRRPYTVLVSPLSRSGALAGANQASVAVFIADPDDRAGSTADVLMRLFKLTPAEARLATLLAAGAPLAEAADALAISRETARTQLKSIFSKTETTRQAELARLIARACPIVSSE